MKKHQRRKLTVILHADVVGSTTLVQRDETLAHDRIQDSFRRFSETIKAYGGSTHELRGDALVAEFDRASDAVCAALAFQANNTQFNSELDGDVRPELRVGISMGEMVIADRTVTGPGVVLAQRLEQMAKPGGVIVQGAAHETIPRRLPFEYEFLGEREAKGFAEPVRAHTVSLVPGHAIPLPEGRVARKGNWFAVAVIGIVLAVAGGLAWFQPWLVREEQATVEQMANPLPDKPSIAVLPFANISGDSEQEYFSDGISEDIITDLSRLANLDVISRNSAFTYKGVATKVQEIGKDLNVQYVLEGSVRKSGNHLRISAQLIDASNGHHLWAERYDRELKDIFELQDEIAHHIVKELSIQLSEDDVRTLGNVETSNFEAYDLFLKGQRAFSRLTKEGFDKAIELYEQATKLDPGFARAYGGMAVTLIRQKNLGYTDSPAINVERALELAQQAASIEPRSPNVLWALAFVLQEQKRWDEAVEALNLAVSISPSFADGYGLLALIKNMLAESEEAIRLIEKGMKLNPYYTWDYLYNLGRAYYALGDYNRAVQYLEQAIERNEAARLPRLFLIASYIRLGQQDDAEWEVVEIGMLESNTTLSNLRRGTWFVDTELREQFLDDLSTAGLPD